MEILVHIYQHIIWTRHIEFVLFGRGAIGINGRSIDPDGNFVGVPVFPALVIYNRIWCLL